MENVKMSDVFELPMKVDGHSVESQPYTEVGFLGELVTDITCDNERDAVHVAHAINTHDQHVERIKELEKALLASTCAFECFYDLDSNDVDPFHCAEYEAVAGVVSRNKQLLEQSK